MKRIFLSAIGCLLLIGCGSPYDQKATMFAGDTNFQHEFSYSITVIDKCQYITWSGGEAGHLMTHKGNCTNCQAIFRAWYAENK